MKKIAIEIDEDIHRALVAFAVLNDTESLDLCLAEIMCDATMSQSGEEIYGNLGITSQKLVDKKRKQYASIDIKTEG
jgi:hypothetical protein